VPVLGYHAWMPEAPAAPPVLGTEGLTKSFGDIHAVSGVGLRIEVGEVRGLLGPNGAGKTTLLRMLLGLIRPDAGSIALLGGSWDPTRDLIPQGVAGFVESPSFYPYLSGRATLELLGALDGGIPPGRIDDALEMVDLSNAAKQRVGEYSTGMRQRLAIAACMLSPPVLLLLDEPTIGLDPAGARDVRALLRRLASDGVAVLLSSHNVAEVEDICDSVTIMRSGMVVWDGTVERLRAEAPEPAHLLVSSDDDRALAIAREQRIDAVPNARGGLTISASKQDLDAFVIALGRDGIAVQRLDLVMSPLETMFFELTGARGLAEAEAESILQRSGSGSGS
jgi:ABC-2 type transport system ATP-binding protein